MPREMTDPELLKLVQRCAVSELTTDQINLLCERVEHSAELRSFFSSRLRWQQYLADLQSRAANEPNDPPQRRPSRSSMSRTLLVALCCLAIGVVFVWSRSVKRPAEQPPSADKPAHLARKSSTTSNEKLPETPTPNLTAAEPEQAEAAAAEAPAAAPLRGPEQETPAAAPWIVGADRGPPDFADVCFTQFDPTRAHPTVAELQRWLAPANGPVSWITERTSLGESAGFDGVVRLRAPWPTQGALRLAVVNRDPFTIHLFHGQRGVAFVFYPTGQSRWAAYVTHREQDFVGADREVLASADDGRSDRTGFLHDGLFELRYAAGRATLSRGDVVLASAPLPSSPDEMLLAGRVLLRGITVVSHTGEGPQPLVLPARETTWKRPADELTWQGASPLRTTSGGVSLAGNDKLFCFTQRPRDAAGEIVLAIDQATAGSGIGLVDEAGETVAMWYYEQEIDRGALCLVAGRSGREDNSGKSQTPALVEGPHLVRIVVGMGVVRCWLGADGVSWASIGDVKVPDTGRIAGFGVGINGDTSSSISLAEVRFRAFSNGQVVTDPRWQFHLGHGPTVSSFEDWSRQVAVNKPAECDGRIWTVGCAARQLANGGPGSYAIDLVDVLADEAVRRQLRPREQLALLSQLSLLLDPHDHDSCLRLLERYEQVGLRTLEEENGRPFSQSRRHLMCLPLSPPVETGVVSELTLVAEALQLLDHELWEEVAEYCEMLRYFHLESDLTMFPWMAFVAAKNARTARPFPARQRPAWRELLVEEAAPAIYEITSRFSASIETEDWETLGRQLVGLREGSAPGCAPAPGSERLLVSLPVAMTDLHQSCQPLEQVLQQDYAEQADMRATQAIQSADPVQVEFVARQFGATRGAARARRWLGDRAMAAGWLAAAERHYRISAAKNQDPGDELARRMALIGELTGETGQTALQKQLEISASAAEISELRRALADFGNRLDSQQEPATPPVPREYRVARQHKLNGPAGRHPDRVLLRQVKSMDIDWIGRQLGVTFHEGVCYISNRFHVQAFVANSGDRLWRSEPVPLREMLAQDWPLIPMRPLVDRELVITRLLYAEGPSLVCLDRQDGSLRWTAGSTREHFFASDPWWMQEQLCCLTVQPGELSQLRLMVATIDPETGTIWSERELLKLDENWSLKRTCQVRVLEEDCVATLGGLTCCFGVEGRVNWLRRELAIPPESDPHWVRQEHGPPVQHGEKLIVVQPGVRAVSCLNQETGRRHWHRVLPDVTSLIGVSRRVVVVRERGGARGLEMDTGRTLWTHRLGQGVATCLDPATGYLATLSLAKDTDDDRAISIDFETIDVSSGETRWSGTLPEMEAPPQQVIGPIFMHGDALWVFHGAGDPTRSITVFGHDHPSG